MDIRLFNKGFPMRMKWPVPPARLTLAVLVILLSPHQAWAEGEVSISGSVSGTPNIGKVTADGFDTFRVDATTASVMHAGHGVRVGPAIVAVPSYTVECASGTGASNRCGVTPASVTITVRPATTSGEVSLAAFNIAVTPGIGASACEPVLGQETQNVSVTCKLAPQSDNEKRTVVTIKVGMSITVTGGSEGSVHAPAYIISTN